MTPEQIARVEDSLRELDGRLDGVAADFYRRLFATHPELRSLFADDISEQRAKFGAQLGEIVRAVRDVPAFLARSAALGARHRGYGVVSAHYAAAAEPLFDSLAEALDSWDETTEVAWRRAYALVAEGMLQGAASELGG